MVPLAGNWNLPTYTLGGKQFWGDVQNRSGWRIQHNVITGHFRLVDSRDIRRAWGTQIACETELDSLFPSQPDADGRRTAVVVVHGIVRSSKSFAAMKQPLEQAGYLVLDFDYPSTQVSVTGSANYLRGVIAKIEHVDTIHFVTHSMGGLLVRAYLAAEDRDPRCGRVVMLGTPNHGAAMATTMRGNWLYRFIYGPAGQELPGVANAFLESLPAPPGEFAIIAGASGTEQGWNPLLTGDDDGTVRVEETRLAGAADFMTVPCLHSWLMSDPTVIDATIRFLDQGVLRPSGMTEPILAAPVTPTDFVVPPKAP